jgi:hydroxymethylpyrimidine/phosphomethylpyrimidine kinase
MDNIPIAMTIAGSDSGGGAGIQADLKTFAFHCVHGTSAITCITAQNTLGVCRVDALTAESVIAQIQAVISDIGVQAVKTGMLLNQEIIEAVSEQIRVLQLKEQLKNLVVDPVMVSRAGAKLINDNAIATIKNLLIPQAAIVTPNRYEAEILSNLKIDTLQDLQIAAQEIYKLGAKAVLVKGGGMEGELKAIDVWFDGEKLKTLKTEVIHTKNTHGTGCTLSAAIAANLALGKSPLDSVTQAKYYVTESLKFNLAIGKGQGCLGHFFPMSIDPLTNPRSTHNSL